MAGSINTQYILGYANSVTGIINGILVPVLLAIAFLVFLNGVYKYFIKGAADSKAQESGRMFIEYGIIGFVVIFAVWGIVWIAIDTLNLPNNTSPTPPTIGNATPNTPPASGPPGSQNVVEGGYCNNTAFFCGAGLTCDFTKPQNLGGGTCVK